jgi:uncharacterized coiled-coil protein SlyX
MYLALGMIIGIGVVLMIIEHRKAKQEEVREPINEVVPDAKDGSRVDAYKEAIKHLNKKHSEALEVMTEQETKIKELNKTLTDLNSQLTSRDSELVHLSQENESLKQMPPEGKVVEKIKYLTIDGQEFKSISFDLLNELIHEYWFYNPNKGETERNSDFADIMERAKTFIGENTTDILNKDAQESGKTKPLGGHHPLA